MLYVSVSSPVSGAVGSDIVDATERRIAKFATDVAAYEAKKAEFDAKQAALKPAEPSPPPAPSPRVLTTQSSIGGEELEASAESLRREFEATSPETRLSVVSAVLYRLQVRPFCSDARVSLVHS